MKRPCSQPTSLASSRDRELELLCLCCAPTADAVSARIRGLASEVDDWEVVIDAAKGHQIIPLVAGNLRMSYWADLPAQVRETLERLEISAAQRGLMLARQLVRVADVLQTKGIQTLALKGPVLAATAYGDVGARQFVDLDILVRSRDLLRTWETLETLGFVTSFRSDPNRKAALLVFGEQISFLHPETQVHIEIHWRLAPRMLRLALDFDALWGRRRRVVLGTTAVQTLGIEDTVILLCAHGSKHRWARLKWVADVAHQASRESVDWETLFSRARWAGALRTTMQGLSLAARYCAAPLPAAVLERLAAGDESLMRAAAPTLEAQEHFDVGLILYHLRTRDTFFERLRYLWILIFAPGAKDWAWVSLPKGLHPLYYALRPFRLLRRVFMGFRVKR